MTISNEKMSEIRTEICNMSNSQLRNILEHVEHELDLSEKTIEDGMEVRE